MLKDEKSDFQQWDNKNFGKQLTVRNMLILSCFFEILHKSCGNWQVFYIFVV